MPERTLGLQFPVAGLNRRFAIQKRPPFSTSDCMDMRPFDSLGERERGGSRPGLVKHDFPAPGGSGVPVNMLSAVTVGGGQQFVPGSFVDLFNEGGDLDWAHRQTMRLLNRGLVVWESGSGGQTGYLRRHRPSSMDVGLEYSLSLNLLGHRLEGEAFLFDTINGTASLDFGLSNLDQFPPGRWTRLELRAIGTVEHSVEVFLVQMDGATELQRESLFQRGPGSNPVPSFLLRASFVPVNGVVTFEAVERGVSLFRETRSFGAEQSVTDIGAAVGFTLTTNAISAVALEQLLATFFQIDYVVANPPTFPVPDSLLVGAAGGTLVSQDGAGGTHAPLSGATEQQVKPLMAVDAQVPAYGGMVPNRVAGPRLFIADYGDIGSPILPKVYDPVLNELRVWETDRADDGTGPSKGTVPIGNHIIARFLGRIYLAGFPPHQWSACRVGDPMDWDFGAGLIAAGDDPSAAIFDEFSELGDIGEPLRAMAPFVDDYMIFGTPNRLFRLSGDPRSGARFLNVSTESGIASPQAWAMTPEGAMVYLDQERGLFLLAPGAQTYPEALSANVLPRELRDINLPDTNVQVAYDHRRVGIHIILSSISGRSVDHWWYDRRTGGFWPFSLDSAHLPMVTLSHQSVSAQGSGVLLGCNDGFVRRFDASSGSDDGVPFAPHVLYGPFNLAGGDATEGVLRWIRSTVVASGDLDVEVITGTTAVNALDPTSEHRRVFTGKLGSASMERRMVQLRGVVAYVKVSGALTPWAMETLDVSVESLSAPRP